VRFLRYAVLDEVEGRVNRRRRLGELRVKPRDAKRVCFAGMTAETLEAVLRVLRPRVRPSPRPSAHEPSEAAPLGN
jgi:hypothetical protein